MGSRVRGVVVVAVVLAVGAFAGSALSQWWTAPIPGEVTSGTASLAVSGERVRVEVLNGGGIDRAAARATELLRDRGFDVVYYGNADTSGLERTEVLLREGREEWAKALVDVLGTGTWIRQAEASRYVDITVILGSDWSPEMAVPEAPEVRERPWWDIRHWFRRPGAPASEDARLADPA